MADLGKALNILACQASSIQSLCKQLPTFQQSIYIYALHLTFLENDFKNFLLCDINEEEKHALLHISVSTWIRCVC